MNLNLASKTILLAAYETKVVSITGTPMGVVAPLSDLMIPKDNGYVWYRNASVPATYSAGGGYADPDQLFIGPTGTNRIFYPKGFGVLAPGMLEFDLSALPGSANWFQADCGIDWHAADGGGSGGQEADITFQVWGGNVKLFDSGSMKYNTTAKHISVPLKNYRKLTLKALATAYPMTLWNCADWGDCLISITDR